MKNVSQDFDGILFPLQLIKCQTGLLAALGADCRYAKANLTNMKKKQKSFLIKKQIQNKVNLRIDCIIASVPKVIVETSNTF